MSLNFILPLIKSSLLVNLNQEKTGVQSFWFESDFLYLVLFWGLLWVCPHCLVVLCIHWFDLNKCVKPTVHFWPSLRCSYPTGLQMTRPETSKRVQFDFHLQKRTTVQKPPFFALRPQKWVPAVDQSTNSQLIQRCSWIMKKKQTNLYAWLSKVV